MRSNQLSYAPVNVVQYSMRYRVQQELKALKMLFLMMILTTFWAAAGCVMGTGAAPAPLPTTSPQASGWQTLTPGLEQRTYRPEGAMLGQLYVVRVDPTLYTFRAHYRPGAPLSLNGWQQALPDAVGFVNANFFDPNHNILGLLVADGVVYGQSYQDRGGTFLVHNGQPRIRSNVQEPYTGEPLEQAVQAFPMLVLNGAPVYVPTAQERVSRRTVIAQDQQGRVLLIVTPLTGLSLADISVYLAASDMGIVNALNLDGGGSTMVYLNPPGSSQPVRLTSFDPVPAVLALYAR